MLSCAYTTQLLHSTVEVCWNKYNIYFIWINLCAKSRDKLLSGGPESGPVWGWSIPPTAHVLALLWEPN